MFDNDIDGSHFLVLWVLPGYQKVSDLAQLPLDALAGKGQRASSATHENIPPILDDHISTGFRAAGGGKASRRPGVDESCQHRSRNTCLNCRPLIAVHCFVTARWVNRATVVVSRV